MGGTHFFPVLSVSAEQQGVDGQKGQKTNTVSSAGIQSYSRKKQGNCIQILIGVYRVTILPYLGLRQSHH